MTSITIVYSPAARPVPGIPAEDVLDLFVMHAIAVRSWISDPQTSAEGPGWFVVADDSWVNTGGYQSLTIPAPARDLAALAAARGGVSRQRAARGGATEKEYGCVRCQAWHGESDGPVYAEHLLFQSKHGTRLRPAGGWPGGEVR